MHGAVEVHLVALSLKNEYMLTPRKGVVSGYPGGWLRRRVSVGSVVRALRLGLNNNSNWERGPLLQIHS